jgi:hypothetical protein
MPRRTERKSTRRFARTKRTSAQRPVRWRRFTRTRIILLASLSAFGHSATTCSRHGMPAIAVAAFRMRRCLISQLQMGVRSSPTIESTSSACTLFPQETTPESSPAPLTLTKLAKLRESTKRYAMFAADWRGKSSAFIARPKHCQGVATRCSRRSPRGSKAVISKSGTGGRGASPSSISPTSEKTRN